jgi:hypothetical protein
VSGGTSLARIIVFWEDELWVLLKWPHMPPSYFVILCDLSAALFHMNFVEKTTNVGEISHKRSECFRNRHFHFKGVKGGATCSAKQIKKIKGV